MEQNFILISYQADGEHPYAMIRSLSDINKMLAIFRDGHKRFADFRNSSDRLMEVYIGGSIKCFDIYKINE